MTYKLAAKTMSRLMASEAASIFLWRAELPIIAAAFLNSRQVSSSRTIVLTMSPSGTSVSSQMSANGVPCEERRRIRRLGKQPTDRRRRGGGDEETAPSPIRRRLRRGRT